MNTDFIKKINFLIEKNQFDEAEKEIKDILRLDTYNTDLWLRLAVLETIPPLSYYPKAIESLNKILEYDDSNFDAILLLICINHYMIGFIEDELINKINNIKTDDKEKLSMLEYAKCWYFQSIDENKYVESLQKSIELYPYHVFNYEQLAQYYKKNGEFNKANTLIEQALKNVNFIYCEQNNKLEHDDTSIDKYFNEFVKGTHITDIVYNLIKSDLTKL